MAISINQTNADDFISPHSRGAVKQHILYDAYSRMQTTWVAVANAQNGEKCLRTDYQYQGVTNLVTGMKETLDSWNSTWDF